MWTLLMQLHAVGLETNSVTFILLNQSFKNIWFRKPLILRNLVPTLCIFLFFHLYFVRIHADLQHFIISTA
jgi:hypothetical protein